MSQQNDARERLLRACYSFLVPIARFLLRSGVSFNEFQDISRTAFVRVAATDYGIRGRETNTSRIAAMTGISRREVARIRDRVQGPQVDPRIKLSPASDVLHRWHTDPAYLDQVGRPIPLPLAGHKSFASLVASVSRDIPPGAMRAELQRSGAATEVGGRIVLCKRHVVPDSVDDKIITALVFNLRGLAATIAHNSDPTRTEPGWIERFVHSGLLNPEVIVEMREHFRSSIRAFSEEVDDRFAQLEQLRGGGDPPAGARRMGVGIYYTEDDVS